MMAGMLITRPLCAAVFGVCALGMAPGSAWAQPSHTTALFAPTDANLGVQQSAPPRVDTVAVLILSGEESGVPLSEVYGGARRAIELHTALNVAPLDAIGLAVREEAVRECAGKAACFAEKVRGGSANLLLTVSVDRIGEDEGLLLGLRLVDVVTEQQIGAAGDEVPAGMSLFGAMEQQLPGVFPRSVWDQIGVLLVKTTPSNAEVTIGGRSCASPCELKRLVPGTYEAVVRKTGYIDWKGPVTVQAQKTVTLERTLDEPEGSIAASPWLWGGIGLAAVGAGIAAFLLLRSDDRLVNVCVAPNPMDCGG